MSEEHVPSARDVGLAAPAAEPVVPRPLTNGRRVGIVVALGVLGAAVSAGAIVVFSLLVVQLAERHQVVTRYESAELVHDTALASLDGAAEEFCVAQQALLGAGALLDSILALDGEPISEEASTALRAARADVTSSALPASSAMVLPEPVERPEHPRTLSDEELESATTRMASDTKGVDDASATYVRLAESAQDAASSADAAIAEFVVAVVSRGQELIAERSDASKESLQALHSALDTLSEAEADDVFAVLGHSLAVAGDVVRSSNTVRIDDPNSITVVVNKQRPLKPQSFVPKLVRVNVPYVSTPLLRQEATGPLVEMFAAFRAETGQQLRLQNSYRSYATQTNTYNYHVSTKGQAQADRGSARPGHSEHQTGLSLDVNAVNGGCSIRQCFGDMVHGKWLDANAWRFGWIIRYPEGYEHITGYDWEPWHLRYVGTDVSTEMHDRGIVTLEEFFGLDPAPTY